MGEVINDSNIKADNRPYMLGRHDRSDPFAIVANWSATPAIQGSSRGNVRQVKSHWCAMWVYA